MVTFIGIYITVNDEFKGGCITYQLTMERKKEKNRKKVRQEEERYKKERKKRRNILGVPLNSVIGLTESWKFHLSLFPSIFRDLHERKVIHRATTLEEP